MPYPPFFGVSCDFYLLVLPRLLKAIPAIFQSAVPLPFNTRIRILIYSLPSTHIPDSTYIHCIPPCCFASPCDPEPKNDQLLIGYSFHVQCARSSIRVVITLKGRMALDNELANNSLMYARITVQASCYPS